MNKTRKKIYININLENEEIIYSGITFIEFIKYLNQPLQNIILLKADYMGNKCEHNFEILEGTERIAKLFDEDIYNYGDFCFIDYQEKNVVSNLSEQNVAELLYIAHMFKPLESPFIDMLQNRFVYLAHDDGFYCKLFCKDMNDFMVVLCKKIFGLKIYDIQNTIFAKLIELSSSGIIIDLDEMQKDDSNIKIYTIGKYSNMDIVLNNFEKMKNNAIKSNNLRYNNGNWILS